jgi:hypothetical protein
VGQLVLRRQHDRHAVVVVITVPPARERPHPVAEAETEAFLEEAPDWLWPRRLDGRVLELEWRAPGVGSR